MNQIPNADNKASLPSSSNSASSSQTSGQQLVDFLPNLEDYTPSVSFYIITKVVLKITIQ
jgi:hypothetical protein